MDTTHNTAGDNKMTKRDFDNSTKQNWGGPWMASDERAGYREDRFRDSNTGDMLKNRRPTTHFYGFCARYTSEALRKRLRG